jgi:tetratricopeptide (TPR) repeat protein
MNDETLYSARDVAHIFALKESRVLYWARTGFVGPSVKKQGRLWFTFQDLISVKAAKELLERGISLQSVRKNLAALRTALPQVSQPLARLRVASDGERLVVAGGDAAPFEALSGQLVIDFAVAQLSSHVAEVMELPSPEARKPLPPAKVEAERTAYGWFLEGCAIDEAEKALSPEEAEKAASAYRRALSLDPQLAAAHTNLGNLAYRQGQRGDARESWERALDLDPEQPEARYNLGNLLEELDLPELAILEWNKVLAFCPEFADAHFNLGAAYARAGAIDAARLHLASYLTLDGEGAWAEEARNLQQSLS